MDISIIIVSWKVKELLKKCLQTVLASEGVTFEVIVVDNDSGDGTKQMIEKEFSESVKFIDTGANLGFAKANNLGLKQATGEYVLFLNPDTEIDRDVLRQSFEYMKSNPNCGLMGPKMKFKDGSFQSSVRRFPTVTAIILMLLKLPKIFPYLKSINRYLATDFNYAKLQVVDQIMGAFMMAPKQLIDSLNGFDERFFIWFEEVDLCLQVKRAGKQVIYNPQIEIIHHGGKSFAQQKIMTNQWRFFRSAASYLVKNGINPR